MKPLRLVEDTGAFPNRIKVLREMLETCPSARCDRHPINPETLAWDGMVYVFLPGIVVVYDYHEFMATQRDT